MFNAAHEWEAAGEKTRAADDYAIAVERGELGAKETEARARLAELQKGMATIRVEAPSGATVWLAQADAAPAPVSVHVWPGAYGARVRFRDGTTEKRAVSVRANDAARLVFEAPRPPEPSSTQRTLGWIAIGVSGAFVVTAIILGTQTLAARDAFEPDETSTRAHDEAVAYRLWTNVAWGAAGALALTGAVLVLSAPKERAAVGLRFSPTGAALGGRF
jgi:hypothetical protein